MNDVLSWAVDHWGYVVSFVSGGGLVALHRAWLDRRKDRREQGKELREMNLHPLELERRQQELDMGYLKMQREQLEQSKIAQELNPTPNTNRFYGEVAMMAMRLALDLQTAFADRLDTQTIVLFEILRWSFDWKTEELDSSFGNYKPPAGLVKPRDAQSSLAATSVEMLNRNHQSFRGLPALLATWVFRAYTEHEQDKNKSAEEIYQAYKAELGFLQFKLPESIRSLTRDTSWQDAATASIEEVGQKRIWHMADALKERTGGIINIVQKATTAT